MGKECGIYRYSLYVQAALKACGYSCHIYGSCRQLSAAIESTGAEFILLVQHEYGLFDFHSPKLSGPDTTSGVIHLINSYAECSRLVGSAFILHTLVTHDPYYALINKQIFSSGIDVFHLNRVGCFRNGLKYLDHGVPIRPGSLLEASLSGSGDETSVNNRTVAAFGMLSPNKLPADILALCQHAGWSLVGCFATDNKEAQRKLIRQAESLRVSYQFFFDFADEATVLQRLSSADVAINFQERNRHYSTSGSIRFLMNLGVPVICNPGTQFDDVRRGTLQCEPQHAAVVLAELARSPHRYQYHVSRLQRFARSSSISTVYQDLIHRLVLARRKPSIRLDVTSCIEGPKGRQLSDVSPFNLVPSGRIHANAVAHLDLCMAMALDPPSRLQYVCRSLELDTDEREFLSQLFSTYRDSLLTTALSLRSFALWKGALITWGLVDDIQILCRREPSLYELVCSGSPIYTRTQLLRLASSHGHLPLNRVYSHEQPIDMLGDLDDLLIALGSLPRQEAEVDYPSLLQVFVRSLSISPMIRAAFSPVSMDSLSAGDCVLRSTLTRLKSVEDHHYHLESLGRHQLNPGVTHSA